MFKKVAAPYTTEALIASNPIKLSQPAKNPALAPPNFDAHQ
jgi:hypothetical protein